MKKSKIILLLTICLAVASCNKISNDSKEYTAFTIEADKTEVEANGKEMVRFKVIADDGTIISETERTSVRIKEITDGGFLNRGIFTKSSLWNNEEEFVAIYNNIQSTNSVKVKFHNRAKYEKYHQNVALIEIVATWCIYCPIVMTAAKEIEKKYADHSVVMAVHTGSDPFVPVTGSGLGSTLLSRYGENGIPTCIYDLYEVQNTRSSESMGSVIHTYLTDHPATSGIRIESSSLEDGVLRFKTGITSTEDGDYSIAWAILTDWNSFSGGTLSSGIYNNVVTATSDNFARISSGDMISMKAGEEFVKEFAVELPTSIDTSHARLVVMTRKNADNRQSMIIDNVTQCKLGSGIDYILN